MAPSQRSLLRVVAGSALSATIVVLALDAKSRMLAGNTIFLAIGVATASLLIGAPLALVLLRTNVVGRRWLCLLLLTLLFVPLYLQAAAWQAGFGLQGWVSQLVGGRPIIDGWRGAAIVHIAAAIPWVVMIVGVGLSLTEPELEEDALLDGTPFQVFRQVTLPRAANSLWTAFLWVALTVSGEMTVTDLFAVRAYAEQIYTEIALGDNLGEAPWNVAPNVLAVVWVCVAGVMLAKGLIPPDRFPTVRQVVSFDLRRLRLPTSLASIAVVAVLVGLPIVDLTAKAGMLVTREEGQLVRRWSATKLLEMLRTAPIDFSREMFWSLLIGVLAATVALVVAISLAWQARKGGWHALPIWMVIAACLAIPGPLVGLGLIACFNSDWPVLAQLYDRSVVVVVIAQSIRALPVCGFVMWYAVRSVPDEILESATLDGAAGPSRLFRIVLPQCRAAMLVAWLAALALAWGELSASILVVPPGVTTLAIQVFGLIHYGVDDRVAGISLFTMAVFFVLALLMARISQRFASLS